MKSFPLYIALFDGRFSGEVAYVPQLNTVSLGYNPFGKGSQFFRGDIDAFEIRQPLTPFPVKSTFLYEF